MRVSRRKLAVVTGLVLAFAVPIRRDNAAHRFGRGGLETRAQET
ncbi:hypothetical protein [Bradyrhizobium elkanii]|nr:hypothetical protein [Bradyrhizobium elkanii]